MIAILTPTDRNTESAEFIIFHNIVRTPWQLSISGCLEGKVYALLLVWLYKSDHISFIWGQSCVHVLTTSVYVNICLLASLYIRYRKLISDSTLLKRVLTKYLYVYYCKFGERKKNICAPTFKYCNSISVHQIRQRVPDSNENYNTKYQMKMEM